MKKEIKRPKCFEGLSKKEIREVITWVMDIVYEKHVIFLKKNIK
jgi:hypothetical protein